MTAVVAVILCIQRMLLRKLFHTIFERIVSAIHFFQSKSHDTVLLFWGEKKEKKESPFLVFLEIVIQNFSLIRNSFWCDFNRKNKTHLVSKNLIFYFSSDFTAKFKCLVLLVVIHMNFNLFIVQYTIKSQEELNNCFLLVD